jgi:hypothetical protein
MLARLAGSLQGLRHDRMSLEHFQIPLPDRCLPIRTVTVSVELRSVEGHRVRPFAFVSDTMPNRLRRQGAVDGSDKDSAPGPAPLWILDHPHASAGRNSVGRPFVVIDRPTNDCFEDATVAHLFRVKVVVRAIVQHLSFSHTIVRSRQLSALPAAVPGVLAHPHLAEWVCATVT